MFVVSQVMYFLETNYTHRGIVTKNPKKPSKSEENKLCKKFEAGDYLYASNSIEKDTSFTSTNDCVVSVSCQHLQSTFGLN